MRQDPKPDADAPARKPGHGDHWLAALPQDDPRLAEALHLPLDAGEGLRLHRSPLTEALDMVQVTLRRRLVTAYPEPRATSLVRLKPRELALWETRVEGWLTAEHDGAGALVPFLTDLASQALRYAKPAGPAFALELAGLAYFLEPIRDAPGQPRLMPAARLDDRFMPDDYWFEGRVDAIHPAGAGDVVDLAFQGGLSFPVASQHPCAAKPGDHVQGYLWLTGRLPGELADQGAPAKGI